MVSHRYGAWSRGLRSRSALSLFAILVLVGFTSTIRAQVTCGNKFVTAKVQEGSGLVTIVTTDGGFYGQEKPLTYQDMSFLTFRIDGTTYYTNSDQVANWSPTDPSYGGRLRNGQTFRVPNGDTVRTIWKIAVGEIIQDVYPVEFDFSGQIVMKWKFHCLTYDQKTVQMQYLLDTRIVTNDQARVLTRFGYKNSWTRYVPNNPNYNDIPNFYQAFQYDLDQRHNFNPGVVSQGTFIEPELGLIKPDAVVVGDWTILSLLLWGAPSIFPPDTYGDSAVLMEFNPIYASAGQTIEMGRTAYGTGEFETCTGDLYALIFRPRKLKADASGTGYKPNPFTVDMYLFNTNQFTQAAASQATLTVGPHLRILDSGATNNGTTQTQWATPQTIGVGSVGTVTWHVFAEKTCDPDTTYLQFTSKCNLADPGFNQTCKLPVPLPCLEKDTLPPLSYPTVSNGFNKSIAFDDNRPKDKGIEKVLTYGFDPQYFNVTVTPFSPCTHEKVWVNITQLDSTVGGCVTVQTVDCAGNATVEQICFPRYPLHPDTIAPRIRLVHSDTTYDGSFCNMKYDSLLIVDDTVYDLGLQSISIKPSTVPVNITLSAMPFPRGATRQGVALHVIDSMVDGTLTFQVVDVAGNKSEYTANYCTIPDTNVPRVAVVQSGPYEWSVFAYDDRPYDRKLDTISVTNRNNVKLMKNNLVFEPTRQLTRGQASFAFKVEVADTLAPASFCVRAKDLADSTSPDLNTARWWSKDTCLDRQPGKDIWAPNFTLTPSPNVSPTTVYVTVDDIHYFMPGFQIGWDKGIDKLWFSPVDGYVVPDTIYGKCAMTVGPIAIHVADSTAIKTISSVCMHVVDCAGNRSDTCIYYPVTPDSLAPYIYGDQPSQTQLDLTVTDSTIFDRGLKHLTLDQSINFNPYDKTVSGSKLEIVSLTTTNPRQSAIGHLSAIDLWGTVFGKPQEHTTGIDVALWVQDLKMKVPTLAQQGEDVTVLVNFVANDTFALVRKGITQFTFTFDLVGDPNFTYVGVDATGTASDGWTVAGVQTGTRVTIVGTSTNGSPLSRQDLPLINVIMHSSADPNTRSVTLVPTAINNATVKYNNGQTVTIKQGSHATAILPAPSGEIQGATIVAQGYCSPLIQSGGMVSIAALDNVTPNPFTGKTDITYAVPENGYVTLIVYDALGHEITRLVNSVVDQGYHTVTFNPAGLAGGTYYVRLQTGDKILSRKLSYQR